MHKHTAFTLVELLITISIMSILTAVSVISYTGVQARSRDAQRSSDLASLKLALTTYYNAQVPVAYVSSASKITINGTNDVITTALEPNYIKNVPVDPRNSGNMLYKYQSFNSAADFTLFGTFENKNNTKGWAGGSAWVADGYLVSND